MTVVNPKYFVKGGVGETVLLRGTARYAKLNALDQWGKWSCSIYPDQESMAKVHKLISEGVKNKVVSDDDGYRVTFSRPQKIKTKTKGEIELEPVIVEDDDGLIKGDKYVEDGTEITMKLDTYGGASPTGYGTYKAARLVGIRIHGKQTPIRNIPL